MYGMGGYGSPGFGNSGIDGPNPLYDSPRRKTGLNDLIIELDITDHGYIHANFSAEVEQMALKAKLVRCRGSGFYNEAGSTQGMLSIDPWTAQHRMYPNAYPGGEVASHWWVTAWVQGESAGWFQPLIVPKYIPTWLQISGVTWFFGMNNRYQSNIVWNIRNGLKPNWTALQEYEKIAREMYSALKSLAPQ